MPGSAQIGIHNVTGEMLTIALLGMAIVFVTLILITTVIAALPLILDRVAAVFPEPVALHPGAAVASEPSTIDDERLIALSVAAIAARRHEAPPEDHST